MKKIWKFLVGFVACLLVFTSTACNNDKANNNNNNENLCSNSGDDITLDQFNQFLNSTLGMEHANPVAIVPFNHVNGPREEWKFYAIINFVFRERAANYVKYQVTYLSCTCREANVNYWQTAYIELTTPEDGTGEDAVLQKLSFDADGTGHYTAGFWGDSNPVTTDGNYTSPTIATYEKTPNGQGGFYPSFKEDYIPLLIGKTKAEIDQWDFVDDMKADGVMSQELFDSFTGASVSTNNILRILHAVFKYHADTYF